MNNIYVFTTPNCPHCTEVKDRLDAENIRYKDVNVQHHKAIWDEIVKTTEQDYVPTVLIQDNLEDGSGMIYTPINDFNNVEELMEIINNK